MCNNLCKAYSWYVLTNAYILIICFLSKEISISLRSSHILRPSKGVEGKAALHPPAHWNEQIKQEKRQINLLCPQRHLQRVITHQPNVRQKDKNSFSMGWGREGTYTVQFLVVQWMILGEFKGFGEAYSDLG